MTLAQLLAERCHVLLDFDGPVCAVFPGDRGRESGDAMRRLLGDRMAHLPPEVSQADDAFVVLRYFDQHEPELAEKAEQAFAAEEGRTVLTATPTPGVLDAIKALRGSGHTITIVSNNSESAILAFVELHRLGDQIEGIVGRTRSRTEDLKPKPYLLRRALDKRAAAPTEAVLIGDSVTDIQAARAAGTAVIAFANRPEKEPTLRSYEPDILIKLMEELVRSRNESTRPGAEDLG
ncbi:HAD family hydrolase [Pseudonocardia pini]|uniref:HAD family hydrolase n=1 Tax=Pseudonocardia pini TaxID=2758030 RepID=UPI0015F07004|nr:HAD family hydrolase [Pseudonocardia pini]